MYLWPDTWSAVLPAEFIAILQAYIVKTTTKPQHNQTKPNNQQINESWVLQENDFAHHQKQHNPPPHPLKLYFQPKQFSAM